MEQATVQSAQEATELSCDQAIVIFTIAFLLLITLLLFFLFYIQKKQTSFIIKQRQQEEEFTKELHHSIIEIQENTLTHVGREIHDNIGQLLSVINLQLASFQKVNQSDKIQDVQSHLKLAIEELRGVSHSLSSDFIDKMGLEEALKTECERINKSGVIKVNCNCNNYHHELDKQKEIILLRIAQEFLNNSIKHSNTSKIDVDLNFKENSLILKLRDFGDGFDMQLNSEGMGIKNILNRAKIIDAVTEYLSKKNWGTLLSLTLKT
ncbi:MAG: histidine kinase [Saprospiraceae bacterium]